MFRIDHTDRDMKYAYASLENERSICDYPWRKIAMASINEWLKYVLMKAEVHFS
ncbi:MAG: hypothetical protein HUJ74_01745 [Lachnospiraceae bacterium]|nr:hypothetical protein [Lachnospiraceae bacterium]